MSQHHLLYHHYHHNQHQQQQQQQQQQQVWLSILSFSGFQILLLVRVASMYNNVCFTQNADLWSWTVNVSAVKVLKATDCVSLGPVSYTHLTLPTIRRV